MAGFTPDPWRADGLSVVADGRGIIAMCLTPQNNGVMECSANARLIAAAPELYEALEAANASMGDGRFDLTLAKARGRS